MNTLTLFGYKLKEFRVRNGFSQEKLAEITGLHRTYISSLERGNRNPTLMTLKCLAKALDITISELTSELDDD